MAYKGVTRAGDIYCMGCGSRLSPGDDRCHSCYSELDQEVRAFVCPRCDLVLELGTSVCGRCGMKFKTKTVRPSDEAEEERLLAKLSEMGRRLSGEKPAGPEAETEPGLASEEASAVSEVVRSTSELADLRAEVSSVVGTRLSETRRRVSRMMEGRAGAAPVEDLDVELGALAEEVAGLRKLIENIGGYAEEVVRVFSSPGLQAVDGAQALSSKAKGISGAVKSVAPEDLRAREEKVAAREGMVDRKIRAYAEKKKQLDAAASGTVPEAARAESDEREARALAEKARALHGLLSADVPSGGPAEVLGSLETHVRTLVDARAQLEQREAQEEEVRKLLKVLDSLLGQLPEAVIERFSKSEDFRLYERVLDRLRV